VLRTASRGPPTLYCSSTGSIVSNINALMQYMQYVFGLTFVLNSSYMSQCTQMVEDQVSHVAEGGGVSINSRMMMVDLGCS
jgi:hypothetical protein